MESNMENDEYDQCNRIATSSHQIRLVKVNGKEYAYYWNINSWHIDLRILQVEIFPEMLSLHTAQNEGRISRHVVTPIKQFAVARLGPRSVEASDDLQDRQDVYGDTKNRVSDSSKGSAWRVSSDLDEDHDSSYDGQKYGQEHAEPVELKRNCQLS